MKDLPVINGTATPASSSETFAALSLFSSAWEAGLEAGEVAERAEDVRKYMKAALLAAGSEEERTKLGQDFKLAAFYKRTGLKEWPEGAVAKWDDPLRKAEMSTRQDLTAIRREAGLTKPGPKKGAGQPGKNSGKKPGKAVDVTNVAAFRKLQGAAEALEGKDKRAAKAALTTLQRTLGIELD